MKFISFLTNSHECLGWLQEKEQTVLVIDSAQPDLPQSMSDLVASGDVGLQKIQKAKDDLPAKALSEVQILPPLTQPRGIFCVGLNYAEHEREAPVAGTDFPTIFLRLARNQIADGAPMIRPTQSDTLDWEGELVAVIGKAGRHIAPENAFNHIFGYSIYNEASVRGFQHHSSQFGMGKNFEGTGAFGPCLITAEAFGDPYAQRIETRLDGETVQAAQIGTMTHRIEDVIAYISSATTLLPGDIICTGTPSGVGAARKPQRFMQPGETVEVSISGIGTLRNTVQAESLNPPKQPEIEDEK
jgi:2-keto-4-pentenoate hydratase/2-oxohepta-3-ene-1,7-dioic acid hydratase in catechol pathway